MRKLRLELEELKVESFGTEEVREEKGTVFGRATAYETCFGQATCAGGGDTCWDSCIPGCGTHYCPVTEGNSCQQATCVIWSCRC